MLKKLPDLFPRKEEWKADMAAFNAVMRVDDFACIPEQGIATSISTFIAQNRGQKKRNTFSWDFAQDFGWRSVTGF
ncbi:MAG: hypothetical protein NC307_11545 [Roseburia sp.]|nr:hypothetical protein [Roseburia sp.]